MKRNLGFTAEEHQRRGKTALRAVQNLTRQTLSKARRGDCYEAFDSFSALSYWMGVLETHAQASEHSRPVLTPTLMTQFDAAKQAVRHCERKPRRR